MRGQGQSDILPSLGKNFATYPIGHWHKESEWIFPAEIVKFSIVVTLLQ